LQLTFDVGVVTIFGRRLADHVKEELREHYLIVEKGYNSFPIPVPFTSYSQAIKVCDHDARTADQWRSRSIPSLRHNVTNRLLLMHACRRGGG
jgi:hypothetical protein